jgi:hypothetical protein
MDAPRRRLGSACSEGHGYLTVRVLLPGGSLLTVTSPGLASPAVACLPGMYLPDYTAASPSNSFGRSRLPSRTTAKGKARAGDELVQLDPLFLQGYPPHLVAATQRLDLSKSSARITVLEWAVGITPPGPSEESEGVSRW